MVLRTDELINAAALISEKQGFRASAKGAAVGGLLTGGAAALTGMALGPVGLLVGGAGGGLLSFLAMKNSFKPLSEIIRTELTPFQQQQLANHLNAAVRDIDATDAIQLVALVMSNEALLGVAASAITNFAQNELQLRLQ